MVPKMSNYFRFQLVALTYTGMGIFLERITNKNNLRLYKLYHLITIIFLTFLAFSDIVKVFETWQSERQLSNKFFFALNTQGVHFCSYVKIVIFLKNKRIIERLLIKLENETARFKCYTDIEDRMIFYTKALTYSLFTIVHVTIAFMFTYTLIKDIEIRKTVVVSGSTDYIPRELPIPIFIPWDYSEDWPYVAAFVCCVVEIPWMSIPVMMVDTLMASIMMHISGRLRMVGRTLENIGSDTVDQLTEELKTRCIHSITGSDLEGDYAARKIKLMEFATPNEFDRCMKARLKSAIRFHQLITEIVQDLQDAYSYGFFVQITSSLYTIGLVMVELSGNSDELLSFRLFNSFGFFSSALMQLFIQTYSANLITTEAENIAASGYDLPWYDADVHRSTKTLTLFLIQITQKPVFILAANQIPMTNELFQSVVKISYQIFSVIIGRVSD